MRVYKLLFLLLFTICYVHVSAQTANVNILDSFSAEFIKKIRANEKQQAFLVTDKFVFMAGEYIWFKAFLVNSISQKQTSKSKFLFVDLVNDKDSVIKRLIMDAGTRQLSARLRLPDSLTGGYYWLRAYTAKQITEDDLNSICVKPLYVESKLNNQVNARPKNVNVAQDDIPVITFYPEGGNIMTGINSTVALKANSKNGEPIKIEGYIKDNRDTIVSKFITNQNGYTKFDFEPSGYKKYIAAIMWNGKEIRYTLPAFKFKEGQLAVTKERSSYKLRVLLGDSIYKKNELTYVVGISKDSLVFAGIGHDLYEVSVDERKLPDGMATFYLFSKDFQLLSERSIYVRRNSVEVKLSTDKDVYTKHNKVALNLSITDGEQYPVPAVISIAVSDSILTNYTEQCSLDSQYLNTGLSNNLLLTGNNCITNDDIDLMMLAKQNTYTDLIKSKLQLPVTITDSLLYIKGSVVNEKKEPVADRIVFMISNAGGEDLFISDTTDDQGRFSFPVESYRDSAEFAFQVKDLHSHEANNKVLLDKITYPNFTTPASLKQYPILEPIPIHTRLNSYYQHQWNNENEKQLTPVTVRQLVNYDESKRVSLFSSIITSKDLDGRTSVDNLILRVSGIQLLNGYVVVRGLNAFKSPGPNSEPMILVEGAQVSLSSGSIGTVSPVLGYLSGLNPKDIDFIEVLKDGAAANYGVRGANGVILINLTNRGRDITSNQNNMQFFHVNGITKPSIFPSVNYDIKERKNIITEDYRSTIFWNGNFLTGDAASDVITFYTSDIPATYAITIKGVTIYGDIISKTIMVKSK